MLELQRTDSGNPDFQALVAFLDRELQVIDGEEHYFFAQFNKIDSLRNVVVAYLDQKPIGCGAFKEYEAGVAEVKRMYVQQEYRGVGIATKVLQELESWAADLGYSILILETGIRQPDAIALYQKNGYQFIPNFGQYAGVESSVCLQKKLMQLTKEDRKTP